MDEITLAFNEETGMWEEKKEPYCTIEISTKEDFDFLNAAVNFYRDYLAKNGNGGQDDDHLCNT